MNSYISSILLKPMSQIRIIWPNVVIFWNNFDNIKFLPRPAYCFLLILPVA